MAGSRSGLVVASLAVLAATALAVVLERWFHIGNLVLVYVLAVVAIGLLHGYAPAIVASAMSFLSFNFFLTEPRYTLKVERQEELATLIFLLLIALISGSAASRIRRQFMLLHQTNRYSEAMRDLSQTLSGIDKAGTLWRETAAKLAALLERDACMAIFLGSGQYHLIPNPENSLAPEVIAALSQLDQASLPSKQGGKELLVADWSFFPLRREGRCIVCVLIQSPRADQAVIKSEDCRLIQDMLELAGERWQRIELAGNLESARISAEVEQLRSALLSSVSHDLKSPLAAMMGAAESLRLLDKQLSAQDRQELVDTILEESRRLDSYIQNLLDMTRLGHGGLKIERDWVSVGDLVGSALARLKRYHPQIQTEVRLEGAPPLISVHAALVEQALFNILENAARFTPPQGKIHIEVSREDQKCVISVEDQGPGVPESLREKIFDMFYVVAEGDRKPQGTGMGLAICRGMIGAHGGKVWAAAGSGSKGTRMVVELPMSESDTEQAALEDANAQ